KQDFSCFSKSNTQVFTNICDITRAEWQESDNGMFFHVTADRFLRNMVRAIVGTLMEIGTRGKPVSFIDEVLASGDRSRAGISVPAQGLYLSRIVYPYIVYFEPRETRQNNRKHIRQQVTPSVGTVYAPEYPRVLDFCISHDTLGSCSTCATYADRIYVGQIHTCR